MADGSARALSATGSPAAIEAGPLRAVFLLVAVTIGLVAVESLALPELFASPAYDTLRPYLRIFGGASLIAVVGAAAVASGRLTRLGIAGGLLIAGLPASVLAIAFLSTGSPIGAWAWSVLTTTSVGLGVALLTGRAPRWQPVPVAIGLVLAGNGALMLASPWSFSRAVYGELVDALLPFGVVLVAAGAGLVAGETFGRRSLALAAAALAEIGLLGLVATFVATGLWVGVALHWMLALVLVVALLGEVTLRRTAIAQLALLAGLGAWMLASHLRGQPATDPDAFSVHAAIVALVVAWLLAELRPKVLWLARALAAVVVVLTAADMLGLWGTPGGAGGIAPSVILPIDTGVILAVLAALLLARSWWPDAGVVLVASVATATATVAFAAVHLLVTTITADPSLLQPTLDLEQDQAFLLFGMASSLGLLAWRRGVSGPIQPRVYAAAASVLVIVSIGSVISGRALEALARPGEALEPQILALTDRLLVLLLAVLVITLGAAAAVISRQIVRPIERMIGVARRRTAGDRTVRADLRQSDELGVLGSALDAAFAAQDAANEQTDAERRRLRTVITSALDAFVAIDPAGRISDWNPQAQAIFGWSAEEALGRPLFPLIVPPMLREACEAATARFFQTGERRLTGQRVRFPALHRDGHTFSAEIALSTATDGSGGVSAFVRDISEAERQEHALKHFALYDTLTDLPNRTLVADRWQLATAAAQREGTRIGLALLDLDQFRAVNDALGHAAGDELLLEVGRRLRAAVRGTDAVGHLGGDEFVVLLTELRSPADAVAVGRAMLASLKRPLEIDGRSLAIAASAGIVVSELRDESFAEAFRKADIAMYQAKRAGGDDVVVYTPSAESDTTGGITLGAELRAAIEGDGLRLAYQPVIDADSGEVLEVEALARWDHPQRGPVSPLEFVATAERSGLINALGSWVLERALDDLGRWRAAGLDLGVHVNVSVRQLGDGSFAGTVLDELRKRDLPPGALTVELTESLLVRDMARVREDLVRLRAAGVRISLDDFGTGYSSLGYLQQLPLDEIKLDHSMIIGAVDDARRVALVRAAREIARSLGLAFVAEGVEDERTWDLLASLGDDRMQGFGIGRPMPAEALAGWVATHRRRVEARLAAQRVAAVERSLRAAERLRQGSGSTRSLDDLLTNLWHELRDPIPYDRIGVALLEDDGRVLRARWAKASYSEALRISRGYSAPMAGSSLEEILRTGKPRIIGDLVAYLAQKPDSLSTRLIVGEGVRSSLTCPLIVGDAAVGFIFFSSREPRAYSDAHVLAFQALAALVSSSVARALEAPRLFTDA